MLSSFRDRFGTAGMVIAVIALVAALGGTALAASGALTGKQKKEVEKIAKKFQGTGPAGAQGPAGPAGAKGDKGDSGNAGSAGASGKNAEAVSFSGSKGPIGGITCTEGGLEVTSASATTLVCNGKKGTAGKSVTSEELASGNEHCPEGGSEFEATSVTYACNGSPWTAGGVLPKGATETGTWAYGPLSAFVYEVEGKVHVDSSGSAWVSFPFSVPLKEGLDSEHIHFVTGEEAEKFQEGKFGTGSGELCEGESGGELTTCEDNYKAIFAACPGSPFEPEAKEGHFCVYAIESLVPLVTQFASKAGGLFFFSSGEGAAGKYGFGAYAVTGF